MHETVVDDLEPPVSVHCWSNKIYGIPWLVIFLIFLDEWRRNGSAGQEKSKSSHSYENGVSQTFKMVHSIIDTNQN